MVLPAARSLTIFSSLSSQSFRYKEFCHYIIYLWCNLYISVWHKWCTSYNEKHNEYTVIYYWYTIHASIIQNTTVLLPLWHSSFPNASLLFDNIFHSVISYKLEYILPSFNNWYTRTLYCQYFVLLLQI